MSPVKEISVFKVILVAAVAGAIIGVASSVAWSVMRKREVSAALDANQVHKSPKNVDRLPAQKSDVLQADSGASSSSTLSEYPGATARPLADRVAGQGVDLQVGWFETNDSVDDVISFYRQKLKDAGRWAVSHRYSASAGYVGFFEHDTGLMRLWSVLEQGDHTLVLQSVSHPKAMLSGAPEPAPVVPVLEGVERPMMFEVAGAQTVSKIWFARVKQQKLSGVQDAYRNALSASGWKIENQTDIPGNASQIVARSTNGAQMIIDLRGSPDRSVSVSITLLAERV